MVTTLVTIHILLKNVQCDTVGFGFLALLTRSNWLIVLFQPYISCLLLAYSFLIIVEFVSCCFTDLFGTREVKLLSNAGCFQDTTFSRFTLGLYGLLHKMYILYTVTSWALLCYRALD